MALTKVSYSMIAGAAINVLDYGADPSGVADSTAAIQLAFDQRGKIYLPTGTYKITSSLTLYGNTEVFGDGPGLSILRGSGFTSGQLIQDSSRVTSTDINLNIVLRDFEIDCNSYAVGTSSGIIFYRVGNLLIDNLYIHDCGSTALRWGQSYADTINITVSNCRFERGRVGDATQGIGRFVTIMNCYAYSFGDTCYATVADFNATTNPLGLAPQNVTFDNCTAVGDWVNGVFTGSGGSAQLGFGFGPYAITANLYLTVSNCICENLFANLWAVVFNKLKLTNNYFKAHSNTSTGGVRLDGISTAVIEGNTFENSFVAAGPDYQSLLLQASRFIYGSSNFDADIKFVTITGNIFQNNSNPAVQFNLDPTYALISNIVLSSNVFIGTNEPLQFSPVTSSGTGVIDLVKISDNSVNSAAAALVGVSGSPEQYTNFQVVDNNIGAVPVATGSVAPYLFVVNTHKIQVPSVPSGVATTIYTLGSDYHTLQITACVQTTNQAYSAIAEIVNNGGSSRIAWQSNGANFTITLSGLDVQVTQSGIGTQTVTAVIEFTS